MSLISGKSTGLITQKICSPKKLSRIYKILPHIYLPEYDHSLYIDGNFKIIGDVEEYINQYSNNASMLCFKHPQRTCIYDEAEICIKLKKDSPDQIRESDQWLQK